MYVNSIILNDFNYNECQFIYLSTTIVVPSIHMTPQKADKY